jgi:membrane-bound inhibitor of C-type lysozyme
VFGHQIVGGDAEGRGGVERADFYEWGGNNIDGTPGFAENRPGWYAPIKTLLEENHVNIFFHGHDHFFGKQEKDCLIYQETPQPSLPNFQHANMAAEYGYVQGQILPNAGHLRLTVQPEGVQVEYVRAYKPESENATRHNGDISATYFIGAVNCYDSLTTVSPIIWNSLYKDELIYPNPVSDNSTIEFAVKKAEKTTILIHNSQGQLVRVLLDHCYLQAGDFQTDWNGRDASGNRLPAGSYVVSVQGDNSGRRTQKVILE